MSSYFLRSIRHIDRAVCTQTNTIVLDMTTKKSARKLVGKQEHHWAAQNGLSHSKAETAQLNLSCSIDPVSAYIRFESIDRLEGIWRISFDQNHWMSKKNRRQIGSPTITRNKLYGLQSKHNSVCLAQQERRKTNHSKCTRWLFQYGIPYSVPSKCPYTYIYIYICMYICNIASLVLSLLNSTL